MGGSKFGPQTKPPSNSFFEFDKGSKFQMPTGNQKSSQKVDFKPLDFTQLEEDADYTAEFTNLEKAVKSLNAKKLSKSKYLTNVYAVAQQVEQLCEASELDCEDVLDEFSSLLEDGSVKEIKKGLATFMKEVKALYEESVASEEE